MKNLDRDDFMKIVRGGDFVSIFENCRRLVAEGITTVEETKRCINTED